MKCRPASCKHKRTVSASDMRGFVTHAHTHSPLLHICTHACSCLCNCEDVCVEERAALGVTGLAGCCIIFGRAAPSLWRASLKSAGSLGLPLLGSGSPAKPGRAGSLAAAAHSLLEPWLVRGPAPTALCYTQMARLLIGSRALHFHWCSASG